MKYRDIEYTYEEWTTWNNKKANGFTCNDESLLSHVNTVSFSTSTISDMQDKIDYYLDNIEKCKESKKLSDLASEVFYETLNYKGD